MKIFLKRIMAVFLVAVLLLGVGTEEVNATLFSKLFSRGKQTESTKKSDFVVVLDAGHGGNDSGAVGNGLYEKLITLKIAEYCKVELEKYDGVKVYMTREADTYMALDNRVAYATELKADVFVSLHINSAEVKTANGAEVFYPNSSYKPSLHKKGRKLATAIQQNLCALGLYNRGIKTQNSMVGNTYKDGSPADLYAVIRGAKLAGYTGIIVEHAFISNKADAKKFLKSDTKLKQLGVADARGIANCYGLKKKGDAEPLKRTEITKLTGADSSSVYIKWSKVPEASGYEVYRGTSENGKFKKIKAVNGSTKVSLKDRSVKGGKSYYYKVRPYRQTNGKKETAGFCKVQHVKVLKVPKISVKVQSAKIKVSFKPIKGAIRYEVYRSTSKDENYQKIDTLKGATSYLDTKIKKDVTYYYKVRAVSNGVKGYTYSSYSPAKWKTAE